MDGLLILVLVVVFFVIEESIRRSNRQVREELTQAQQDLAKTNIQTLTTAAKAYFNKYEKFPAKLADLVEPLDGSKPFIETDWKALLDPWGKEYQFRTEEEKGEIVIKIWTAAPDGTRIDNAPKK
jgi:hypothetical protein